MKKYIVGTAVANVISHLGLESSIDDACSSYGIYENDVVTVYELTIKPIKKVKLGIIELPLNSKKGKKNVKNS